MIEDIHTHNELATNAIISIEPHKFYPQPGRLYSVGVHPWNTNHETLHTELALLNQIAPHPAIVAIGETGIDNIKGGLRDTQINLFLHHISLSEKLEKPLIIHSVKSHDQIIQIKNKLNPTQKWIIHGFRGNPNIANMYLEAGLLLSYGEKYNPESLKITPHTSMFVETDESTLTATDIYARIATEIGLTITDLQSTIAKNIATTFHPNQ